MLELPKILQRELMSTRDARTVFQLKAIELDVVLKSMEGSSMTSKLQQLLLTPVLLNGHTSYITKISWLISNTGLSVQVQVESENKVEVRSVRPVGSGSDK